VERRAHSPKLALIKALLESEDRDDPVRKGMLGYFAELRTFLRRLAEQAGLRDPKAFLGSGWS
jgi:hypothetical protein